MVKTRRTRKHSGKTRRHKQRGGSNNNNSNNNYNNKEAKALREEPSKLMDSLIEALEAQDIDTLQIFVEQPTYRKVLLDCLEKCRKPNQLTN